MATVKIINAKQDASDDAAVAAAHTWMQRITELFLTERSYQTIIGISEVGSDCRKCVARKLAGT